MAAPAAGSTVVELPVVGQPIDVLSTRFRQAMPVVLGDARMDAPSDTVKAAERFLDKLQRAQEAWAVVTQILEATPTTADPDACLCFTEAARVLMSKIRHDMGGLAASSHSSLRTMLVKHLLRVAGVPSLRPGFRFLATAMAAAAVTMEGWTGIVGSLVAAMGGPQTLSKPAGLAQVHSLLQVLDELPLEARRQRTSISSARRRAVHAELSGAAEAVHSTLLALMTSHAADEAVGKLVIQVFSSWITEGFMPTSLLPSSALTGAVVAGLSKESTYDNSARVLLNIATSVAEHSASDERKAAAASLLPRLWPLEPTLRALIKCAEDDETDERAQLLTGTISVLGKMVVDCIVADDSPLSGLRPGTMQIMAAAASSSANSVRIEALDFWSELMHACQQASRIGRAVAPDVLASAKGLIGPLITAMVLPQEDYHDAPAGIGQDRETAAAAALAHAAAKGGGVKSAADAEELEQREADQRRIAYHVRSSLRMMCEAVSTPAVVDLLVAEVGSTIGAAQAAAKDGDGESSSTLLRRAEAALQCTAYALPVARTEVDLPSFSRLLTAFTSLPDQSGIHETALRVISHSTQWIAPRPEAFAAAEVFVRGHIAHAGCTATVACAAMEQLLLHAGPQVMSSGLIPAFADSMLNLPAAGTKGVMRSLGLVFSQLSTPDAAMAALAAIVSPLLAQMTAIAANPADGVAAVYARRSLRQRLEGITPAKDPIAVQRAGVRGVASLLDFVGHLLDRMGAEPTCVVTGEHLAPMLVALWPAMDSILELGKAEELIVEAVCHTHISLIRRFPAVYSDKLVAVASSLAKRYKDNPFGIYSYTGGVLLERFGGSASAADQAAMLAMVQDMATVGFAKLSSPPTVEPFDNNPQLVDDLFVLLTELAKSMPDQLLGWSLLDAAIRCAFTGLLSSRAVAQTGVLLFLQTVIRLGVPFKSVVTPDTSASLAERITNAPKRKPAVFASIGKYTSSIVHRLIAGSAGAMHKSVISSDQGSISSLLLCCRDLMTPAEFQPFFVEQLSAIVPDSVMHPDVKQIVINGVMSKGVGPARKTLLHEVDKALLLVNDRCMAAFRAGRFDIPTS